MLFFFLFSLFLPFLYFFLSVSFRHMLDGSSRLQQHTTRHESHSCSVVLTYATPASGCGAQGSFQQRRERLARATTRRPLDTTSFVHTPGIPIPNKTVGLSTVAAATCHKPSSQPTVVISGGFHKNYTLLLSLLRHHTNAICQVKMKH
jgi:hypothetical protein